MPQPDAKENAIAELIALYDSMPSVQRLKVHKLLEEKLDAGFVGETLLFSGPEGDIQMASDGKEVFILGASIKLEVLYNAVCTWRLGKLINNNLLRANRSNTLVDQNCVDASPPHSKKEQINVDNSKSVDNV